MKNIIDYFYGIKLEQEIYSENGLDFYFSFNNINYCFSLLLYNETNKIINLYNTFFYLPFIHNIKVNKKGNIISSYKEQNYILMSVKCDKKSVTYLEIFEYFDWLKKTKLFFNDKTIEWDILWRNKVDYLEYYVHQNQSITNEIKCLCNYFIGISENAIKLINVIKEKYYIDYKLEMVTFCHTRIKTDYTTYDLYNPKNIIIDHFSRDVAEYIKTLIYKENSFELLEKTIEKTNFSIVGYVLLFARTMFPTFFYDILDEIDKNTFDKNKLIKIYDYVDKYEKLIIKMYRLIEKKVPLPLIKWLET